MRCNNKTKLRLLQYQNLQHDIFPTFFLPHGHGQNPFPVLLPGLKASSLPIPPIAGRASDIDNLWIAFNVVVS